jgi:hypothetical protein
MKMQYSQQGIADIFNKYLYDFIREDTIQRDGTITLSFARSGLDDCVMTLAIDESKEGHLAHSLFNVPIESVRHVRSLVFPSGVRAELVLKGVPIDVIMHVFCPKIYAAIMASKMRKVDLADGVEVP